MAIDFERARKRLEAHQERLQAGLGPEQRRELLAERAVRVAARTRRTEARELLVDVVAVRRGRELWGLPTAAVSEARRVTLCVLPGLRGAVQGLVHVRGSAVSVLDLAAFTGDVAPPAHGEEQLAVLVTGHPGALALRVDEVLGSRSVFRDECANAGAGDQGLDFVTAVTRDLLAVIDVDLLLARPEVAAYARAGAL